VEAIAALLASIAIHPAALDGSSELFRKKLAKTQLSEKARKNTAV
jgi:hypothetical protein